MLPPPAPGLRSPSDIAKDRGPAGPEKEDSHDSGHKNERERNHGR
jgi:hypothetical protein